MTRSVGRRWTATRRRNNTKSEMKTLLKISNVNVTSQSQKSIFCAESDVKKLIFKYSKNVVDVTEVLCILCWNNTKS